MTPITLWPYDEVGHNHEASNEIKALGLAGVFSNPKPTRLVSRMIALSDTDDKDGIFLDFFGGSCTTAQAVLQANHEDGGSRQFIMVQLPEKCPEKSEAFKRGFETIADIGMERIRRAAAQILEGDPGYSGDLGFKAFSLTSSNVKAWNPDYSDVEQSLIDCSEHLVPDCTEDDILYELLLKRSVELSVPVEQRVVKGKTIYSIGYGALFACLDTSITGDEIEAASKAIISWRDELDPTSDTQVVFRDSAFADDVAKTNMTAILEQNGIAHVRSL